MYECEDKKKHPFPSVCSPAETFNVQAQYVW